MAIIGPFLNNIQNGTLVDATPVMDNFNHILKDVNDNANPIGTLTAPTGTRMSFNQASAPEGWIAESLNSGYADSIIKVVWPDDFVGMGGSISANQLLTGGAVVDSHALSISEMPSHSHSSDHDHPVSDLGHHHLYYGPNDIGNAGGGGALTTNGPLNQQTTQVQTGVTVQAASANIANTGGGIGHSHATNFNIKYVEFIVATKE